MDSYGKRSLYTYHRWMKPPQGFFTNTMSIHKELNNLRNRIKQYQLKKDHSEAYLIWMQQLEQAITANLEQQEMDLDEQSYQYQTQIQELNRQIDANIEVIKKLALIIDAADVEFPTIHQSIETIKNYHLVAKGQADKVNRFDPLQIQVSL